MKKDNHDELVLFIVGFIPVVWLGLKIAPYIHEELWNALPSISEAMDSPFSIVWCEDSLRTVGLLAVIYVCGIGIYLSNKRNYRRQEEYGSAKWANNRQVNRKYADRIFLKNKILSQNVRIGLDGKKHRRNLNTIVIGGSGAGKTRFYGKPNLMQCNTSFVVLDPNGKFRLDYF